MQRNRLGQSPLVVTNLCLGTMTFGLQADEATSFAIMDRAVEQGIDFFDTAELYPVPPDASLFGITESIIGRWFQSRGCRDQIILASKVTGPGHGWFRPPVRHGFTTLDRHQITKACEDSLRRLQTDYLDLYQTHWPDHGMRAEETLAALTDLVNAGKVRVIGCSNETCWGLMNSLRASERHHLARYDSVQNNFSLINRRCESMAQRFVNRRTLETTARLQPIAHDLGISLAALALAWSRQHVFVASTIVGATSVAQLNESLAARDLILDRDTLDRIDAIDADIPNPMTEDGLRRL